MSSPSSSYSTSSSSNVVDTPVALAPYTGIPMLNLERVVKAMGFNSKVAYDIWSPVNENGTVPFIDNAQPGPAWVKGKVFDPADHPVDRNYLGSRKMRLSEDPKIVAVRNLLDNDAMIIGYKVWYRETLYMDTGIITTGDRTAMVKKTFEETFKDFDPIAHTSSSSSSSSTLVAPPLVHSDSFDSVITNPPATPRLEPVTFLSDPFSDVFISDDEEDEEDTEENSPSDEKK